MRNYLIFFRKEAMEFIRTQRFIGLFGAFVFFAVVSPLLARFMLEFIQAIVPAEELAMLADLPEPVWIDSYIQFYGNITQLIALAIVILFMGTITSEKKQGTADLMFMKGLGHSSFVLAKFSLMLAAIVLAMLVSSAIVYGLTLLLFDTAGEIANILGATSLSALFLIWLVSIVVFCSALAKSSAISALLSFGLFIFFMSIGAIPRLGDFLPGSLVNQGLEIIHIGSSDGVFGTVLVAIGLIVAFLGLAIILLKRREKE